MDNNELVICQGLTKNYEMCIRDSRRGEHIIARLYGKHRRVFAAGVIADGIHDEVIGQDYAVKAEFLAENAVHLG